MEKKLKNLMPVLEYARLKNITTSAVYMAFQRGTLKKHKIGNYTFVVINENEVPPVKTTKL